jgi:DNA helicase-2/ATP-dependent DNA helicase PcrA
MVGEAIVRVYQRYQRMLRRQNAVDFGDLIMLAAKVLREQPEVLARYRSRLQHVLVDEYQDTNRAQYVLLRLLANGERPNLCVVGDDDQSIYGWRGAELRNILDFERDFPDATVIVSSKTTVRRRRSSPRGRRRRQQLRPQRQDVVDGEPPGAPVTVAVAEDDLAEARLVMTAIRRLANGGRSCATS